MSEHVSSDRLVAFVDGEVKDPAEHATIAEHLVACIVCKIDHDALAAVDRAIGEAGLHALFTSDSHRTSVDLDTKLQQLAHTALMGASCKIVGTSAAGPRKPFVRSRLLWWPALAAVAAGVLFWLTLRSEPDAQRLGVQASSRDLQGEVRGPGRKAWSLEVRSQTGGYPAVLAFGSNGVARLVYPDPNPVIAEIQAALKLAPHAATRVPKEPMLDFEIAAGEAELLVLVGPEVWDRTALARLLRSFSASAPSTDRGLPSCEQVRVRLPISGR